MTDRAKSASAVFFVLLVLLGVTMWIFFTLERGLQTTVIVRDVAADDGRVERRLYSEDIIQAAQFVRPASAEDRGKPHRDWSRLPAAYWHPKGPAGQALARLDWFPGIDNTWRADARLPASLVGQGSTLGGPLAQLATAWSEPPLGVVQMKAGALAGYARPFQIIDFYESNVEVIALSKPAEGAPTFTYLADADRRGARVRVFEGPELETLAQKAPRAFYHLLFVETARRGDRMAEELITREALADYLDVLAPGGVLCLHVSSGERDVVFKVVEAAAEFRVGVVLGEDRGDPKVGHYPSDWLMIGRRLEALRLLRSAGSPTVRWAPLSTAPLEGKTR